MLLLADRKQFSARTAQTRGDAGALVRVDARSARRYGRNAAQPRGREMGWWLSDILLDPNVTAMVRFTVVRVPP
jgi:hypothetical protein